MVGHLAPNLQINILKFLSMLDTDMYILLKQNLIIIFNIFYYYKSFCNQQMNYFIMKWYTYSYKSKCRNIASGNVNAIFQSFISNVPNARRAYDGGQCGQVASKRVRVILAVGAQSFNSTTPRDIRVSVQLAPHQKVSTFRFEHDLEPVQYYILINEGTTDRQFKYCIFISYCEIIFLMQIFFMFPGTNIGYIGRADSWAMQNYSRQDLWEHSLFPSHWRGCGLGCTRVQAHRRCASSPW